MAERLSKNNPCNACKVDRQIGNPNRWEYECDSCDKPIDWKNDCVNKLAEYETAEEEGRLVVLPCEVAWYIVNKGTPYAMIMPVSINILRLIEIRNIDIDGIYYSTHEKAEKALKEMEVKE